MYLLFLDETNIQPTNINRFFIYGGVFFPSEVAINLHNGVEKIRQRFKYKKTDKFKFETNSKPRELSAQDFALAKQELLDLCIEQKVMFIAYVVKHAIAKNKLKQNIIWASNEIINEFDSFLTKQRSNGLCIFDQLPFRDDFKYLAELFQVGISTATFKMSHPAKNIIFYASSTVEASHLNSIADIILGSFRYCVNSVKTDSSSFIKIKDQINKLFYRYSSNGKEYIRDYGLLVRPHISKFYDSGEEELIKKFDIN